MFRRLWHLTYLSPGDKTNLKELILTDGYNTGQALH